jgi:hypothetical protein
MRIQARNMHGQSSVMFGTTPVSFEPVAGGYFVNDTPATNTCAGKTITPGATCMVEVVQPNPGVSTTVSFTPLTSGFARESITIGPSKNCAKELRAQEVSVVQECTAPEGGKKLRFKVANDNSILTAFVAAVQVPAGDVVTNDNCTASGIQPSSSCTFDMEWLVAPATNDLDARVKVAEQEYFSLLNADALFTADGLPNADNSCPNLVITAVQAPGSDCATNTNKMIEFTVRNPSKFPVSLIIPPPNDGGVIIDKSDCEGVGIKLGTGTPDATKTSCRFKVNYVQTGNLPAMNVPLQLVNPTGISQTVDADGYWPPNFAITPAVAGGMSNRCGQ